MSSTTAQTVTPLRTLPGKKHSKAKRDKIVLKIKEYRKRLEAAKAEVEDLEAKEQVLLEQLRVLQEQKAKTDKN